MLTRKQVTRIVATWYKLGQDEDFPLPNFSTNTENESGLIYPGAVFSPIGVVNKFVDVQADHNVVARAVARDAITLLKNEDNTLPLKANASLKVFGSDAGANPDGLNSCADAGCNKGVLTMGWGSGTARLPYLITPEDAIRNKSSTTEFFITDDFPGDDVTPNDNDIAIVFVNADSGENYITVESNPGDRTTAGLYTWHGGDDLVKDAAEVFSTVVVVVHTVGPIILEEWIDLPSVKSVLFAHLPGQEAGNSLVDVLFGDYSPSGHLPYTIPTAESNYPDSVSIIESGLGQIQDTFTEGLFIDYRHFQKTNTTARYPFGHGLSYTTFEFSRPSLTTVTALTEYPPTRSAKGPTPTYPTTIPSASEVAWPKNFNRVWRYLYPYLDDPSSVSDDGEYPYPDGYQTEPQPDPRAGGSQGGNDALWDVAFTVSLTVQNTGNVSGRAVAQLYVELPSSAGYPDDTPRLQLRQFEKTETLEAGESQVLHMGVTRKDVSVWDVEVQDWRVFGSGSGEGVKLWVGESVEDMKFVCVVGSDGCDVVGS